MILTLSGANNYSGATTISGGTLKISNSGSVLPDSTALTIGAGASLDLSGGFNERIGTLIRPNWNGTLTGNVNLFAIGIPNTNGGLRIGNGGRCKRRSLIADSDTTGF